MSKISSVRRSASVPLLLLSVFLPINCAIAEAEVVTVYTNKADWEYAVGGQFSTEDFTDSQLNTGVSFTSTESGDINTTFGYYHDVLTSQSANEPQTTWSFFPTIYGYGGEWTLGGPGGSGNSLLVYAGSSLYVGAIPNSYGGGFWGFVSDVPFASVKLIGGSGSNQQNYKLDNMVYSSVPEPATLWLLGGGLVVTLLWRRRVL